MIAGGFYDGVMLYSHALNETLNLQGPGQGIRPVKRPRGDEVTRRMWNRTITGEDRSLSLSSGDYSVCSTENKILARTTVKVLESFFVWPHT